MRLSIAVTLLTLLAAPVGAAPARRASARAVAEPDRRASAKALATLKTVLHEPGALATLAGQPLAQIPLTKVDAAVAHTLIWTARLGQLRKQRAGELASGAICDGELAMPFTIQVFGRRPDRGHSLWISLHGGGGVPHEVNDAQWEHQKTLYHIEEGYYVTPRAPVDAWNMWMQGPVDRLLGRLVEDMIVVHGVDPDRVYLFGYGAGGDGVYQLAPRMADTWAAASMMGGHPNGGTPISLRNVAFAVQVGALDTAYGRDQAARDYGAKLDQLRAADPAGYPHLVKLHPDKGAWMDLEDAVALPWMAGFRRDARPGRVVWKQDAVTHDRFYWLAVPPGEARGDALVVASQHGGQIAIEAFANVARLRIRLDDQMADLDQDITVTYRGKPLLVGRAPRTIGAMLHTLADRNDPSLMFDAEITVELPRDPG